MNTKDEVTFMILCNLWNSMDDLRQRYSQYFKQLSNCEQTRLNEKFYFTTTIENAKVLGDDLTELLAKVGFDENYELTIFGKAIETIIDSVNGSIIHNTICKGKLF